MKLLCAVLKHVPDRKRVWFDNVDFRAPCVRCGTPLIKDSFRGWRPFNWAIDEVAGTVRSARPERSSKSHGTSISG